MKKWFHRILSSALTALLAVSLVSGAPVFAEDSSSAVREFTDSVGRTVSVPAEIKSIAPSGPLAQLILYTAYPDRLAGVAKAFGKKQVKYFPEKYTQLPEFGQFYGGKGNLNKEELLAAKLDIIIDLGEPKKTMKEDMDGVQAQLNIPTVFIEAKLPEIDKAYEKLEELLGATPETEQIKNYIRETLKQAKDVKASLKDENKVSVYWAMGDDGLSTNAEASFQSEVLQLVGADNVAKVEAVSKGGGTQVSFEELLTWKPSIIIADNEELAKTIQENDTWQNFLKETGAKLVIAPQVPYGVLSNPPSVNRILGIKWLGNLLYPDLYKVDIQKEVSEFCQLFYHFEPSEDQLKEILNELE